MFLFLINAQLKTWSVALALCLNIGVDPPDVVKTTPCARKECWIGNVIWAWPVDTFNFNLETYFEG